MSELKKPKEGGVTSKVLGVVYTDLVCYILPGFLVLIGVSVVFNIQGAVFNWLKDVKSSGAVITVFALAVPAASYVTGILLSFFRWFLDLLIEKACKDVSLGRLLYGDVSPIILKRVGIPESVLVQARHQIETDLKKLGWSKDIGQTNRNHKDKKVESKKFSQEDNIRLINCFYLLMVSTLRESKSVLFLYYDRWNDIHVGRKNLLIAMQIVALTWGVRQIILFPVAFWWTIPLTLLLIGGLLIVYLYVLPLTRYLDIRWVLLSYLSGRLEVAKDAKLP